MENIDSINRTKAELKHLKGGIKNQKKSSINRTKAELKHFYCPSL